MLLTEPVLTADDATATALLNCLVREVCAPEQQVWPDGVHPGGAHLVVRLPRAGVVLRMGLARPPAGAAYRLVPPYEERRGDEWAPAPWDRLANLVAGELELATGRPNPEFLAQAADSHRALTAIIAARGEPSGDAYIDSEQSLVAGHRFHPSPKARQGSPSDWLRYAPETRARFRPLWLAVPEHLIAGEGTPEAFETLEAYGPPAPPGRRLLPVHPWQFSLLAGNQLLQKALADGLLLNLGPSDTEAVPTSSVRTAYLPDADVFCKFSLDVRITNCVRKNAWYELTGAIALNDLLPPILEKLDATFLAEPAYRSIALPDRRLYEGLGVILRQGVKSLPGTPLLAGALADPYNRWLADLPVLSTPDGAEAWWDAYVAQVAPPVLAAYLDHGVVLEPHLQNVLICVDSTGMPTHAAFRDLEGTKLTAGRWDLTHLPSRVAEGLTYEPDWGWNRVVYCLLVNHLTEMAAAVADLHPSLERTLWRTARKHFRAHDDHPQIRALLAGVPLPAKANLRARWSRTADRGATYVPVPNPLAAPRPL
ncbi:IucA/IucC family protein [Actinomadura madurae]|uniref:IucA/IucC family protein n=1 Tax=Actinomadura madurae TaxID=1993 RepID=UPI0020D1F6CE|nr:IucA/IucC family protein [Actinomadura madurae]MCP9954006.1 IucA/IucC family protein [Actinomadura madurae]MCP9983225.1 IucA/IucC family protein [Actinomadura madurae]MCQ0019473.1 IucA/IucC family protein [Actinomadura madurae]